MKPVDGEYDIIVDDAPNSPNEKDRTWQILTQMLPMIPPDIMTPDVIMDLLEMSPLPASMVEKFKRKQENKGPPPPSPEEMKVQAEMQKDQQKHELEIQGQQADLQAKAEENQMKIAIKAIELFMAQQKAQLDQQVAVQNQQNELTNLAIQEQSNAIDRKNAASKRTESAK